MGLLIQPDELAHKVRSAHKTTILAAVWSPGRVTAGRSFYEAGHVPTSLFCDPAAALGSAPSPAAGRNPLPSGATLIREFNRLGLRDDHEIVVYDQGRGLMAARAWWILTWAGVPDVHILDGGLIAWENAGYRSVGGPGGLARTCTLAPKPGQLPVATIEDVKKGGKLLIDTRQPNRFEGKKEHFDFKAGHIPGAVNVPLVALRNDDFTFKSVDELRRVFDEAGVDDPADVIVMSGSGLHSAVAIAAMHHAGLPGAAHFIGGWSQWCADHTNPVERGPRLSAR